jgi:hypothetical protein
MRGDRPFEALDVFPGHFVVQHVSDIVAENLLPTASFVDADHGDADGPGGIADGQAKVGIVGAQILTRLHVMDDL